jgi:hypothetical protein
MEFWKDLLSNAIGPLLSALIVGVFATWIAIRAQDRRTARDREAEERRAEAALAAQDHEADLKLRQDLIARMTEAASALYIGEQEFWRKKRDDQPPDDPRVRESGAELDRQYRLSRVAGEVLERQLEAYFDNDDPRLRWHATMDLLTVRYFQVTDKRAPLEENARVEDNYHSGLSVEELANPKRLLKEYRAALPRATQAVLRGALRSKAVSQPGGKSP